MQLDLDLIFPIRDPMSAELMAVKAVCLWNAGVIDYRQRKIVEQRAQQFLTNHELTRAQRAALPGLHSMPADAAFLSHGCTRRGMRGAA
jgi:hypothetical protein